MVDEATKGEKLEKYIILTQIDVQADRNKTTQAYRKKI